MKGILKNNYESILLMNEGREIYCDNTPQTSEKTQGFLETLRTISLPIGGPISAKREARCRKGLFRKAR